MHKSFTILLLLLFVTSVSATTYEYNIDNPQGNHAGGQVTNISSSYDTNTGIMNWSYDVLDTHGTDSNGFWLVVNSGPAPKFNDDVNIFYGNLDNGLLHTYKYDGDGWTAYDNDQLISIQSMTVNHTAGGASVSFTSGLASYDNTIGYWFHPMSGANFNYGYPYINSIHFQHAGWYDHDNRSTTEVPEPMTLVLLGSALAGGLLKRRLG